MGADFFLEPDLEFDDVVKKLQASSRVILERPEHVFLYDQWDVYSSDRQFETHMGRSSKRQLSDGSTYGGNVMFHKVGGEPREGARLFLALIGEEVGAEVMTEYGDSVTDADEWSVRYTIGLPLE
ncbi:MAG TPA: hypothetical protein VF905_03940 [Nitrospirota bacterium]